ncbi:MAG: tRNA (N6-threonylcarbamoyladenosine(37)-N6)-methyltransferase TrmO [Spirochaetes bacterium]|nr:tRNA (N6-threonylcarbamoyladenosine(37)-N6)-methyltransferase TrmO [Spirochaetota bacterium]
MFDFKEIGVVRSNFKEHTDPFKMREFESTIEIKKEYVEGLYRIEESEYLEILFCFHKSNDYELKLNNYYGEYKGVFATRTMKRPSNIGLSKVKLLKRKDNILYVKGLDALDGTPVIDIKPYNGGYKDSENEHKEIIELKDNPRKKIIQLVKNCKLEDLLTISGALHGHYCPGLSMGVIGSVYAVNKIKEFSDGMEDILAIIEINSCFADAVQLITGCTFGNNSLIYRDYGKIAFSLVKRDQKGVRLSAKPSYRELQKEKYPEYQKYFDMAVVQQNRDENVMNEFKKLAKEVSFDLLKWEINDIFKIDDVKLKLPDYAPIKEALYCAICGEQIMKSKETYEENKVYCKPCKNKEYFQIDGSGVSVCK